MILIGEKEEKGWVHANYRLTRPVSWQQLLKRCTGFMAISKNRDPSGWVTNPDWSAGRNIANP